MDAVNHAKTFGLTSKIAQLAILFHTEFPNVSTDLRPWLTDQQTQCRLDSNSIDLCFHFPKHDKYLHCDCILVLIYFSHELSLASCDLNKVEAIGFDGTHQQWQFSTVDGEFRGTLLPEKPYQEKFRNVTSRIFELFEEPNRLRLTTDL
jgi:hypothetical protein